MSSEALVELGTADVIEVSGMLDVNSVGRCKQLGVELFQDVVADIKVDLAGVQVHGSAAVALLIAWQREAANLDAEIKFLNPPAQLIAIATACGVENIIPFA